CIGCGVEKVTVKAEKPSALAFAKSAAVEITRHQSFFHETEEPHSYSTSTLVTSRHIAYIALGSNLGDKWVMIRDALLEMSKRDIKVLRTSSLYESDPMYYTN